METKTWRRSLGLTLATTGLVIAASANAATKIQAGTVFLSSTVWPHFVATEKGYLKQAGLEVDIVATRSSAKAVQQLAAGSLNFASSGMPDYIRAIEKGAPIKIVMTQVATPPYMIYAKSSIKKITDLRGKKVIIGGPKDITRYYTESLFKPAGLKPGEYDYLFAGSTSNRFAALVAGGVDAAIMLPPFSLRAAAEGFTNLGNIQTVLSDFPFTVYAVNSEFAQKNRKALINYLAALLKGVRWLYDDKNKSEAADILVKWTRFKRPDALATYDIFFKEINAYRKDGRVTNNAYKQMMDVLIGWGDMKSAPPIGKYYDDSYAKAALKQIK